jgi:hypothetical protein
LAAHPQVPFDNIVLQAYSDIEDGLAYLSLALDLVAAGQIVENCPRTSTCASASSIVVKETYKIVCVVNPKT